MKKNVLSLAVAASVAAAGAQAQVYLNPEGTGQALLFPFYDAENGNATNFHIVNTTERVVAAKIRFREYKASAEVLDFNIFLSAEDHFAFGVIKDPNGDGAAIITSDNTCTVPALGQANGGFDGTTTENADGSITRIQPFTNFVFVENEWVDDSPERTLRGYVEVIEMGRVRNVGAGLTAPSTATQYASFATHGPTGVPANCDGLVAAYTSAAGWGASITSGFSAPAGGLYGVAYHINVDDAAAWGFEPAALADVFDDIQHAQPGSDDPNFSGAVSDSNVLVGGTSTLFQFQDPVSGLVENRGIDAVTSTMMAQQVMNDVAINSVVGGQTDWVTTFPNKYAYTTDQAADAPFTDGYFGAALNAAGTAYVERRACEPLSIETWDREEAFTAPGVGFSPPPPGAAGDEICDEQHLAHWGTGSTSALNAERDVQEVPFAYTEGWARWTFDDVEGDPFDANGNYTPGPDDYYTQALCEDLVAPASDDCLLGLPVRGFAAFKYANGSSDVLMNYGHAADHKTNVVVS